MFIMAQMLLRPDLKTAGGETYDIVRDDQYVGMMSLVFRENDRLSGSVQLERDMLGAREKAEVLAFVQRHVEATAEALNVGACDVIVTYASYERIIVKLDDDYDTEWVDDEALQTDTDPLQKDDLEMAFVDEDESDNSYFELVVMHEERDRVEYSVYDEHQDLVAEAFLTISGDDVSGTIEWQFEPDDEELDAVTELIVSDFDENEIATFRLAMTVEGELIDTVDLKHRDLLTDEDRDGLYGNRDDYSIVLVRDDGDMLTYEIYQQSRGGLPIGTATVDISHRQLTGFIDFREPSTADDREMIAAMLLEELDKEKDYDSFNVSVMMKNKLIDEILFETERVH